MTMQNYAMTPARIDRFKGKILKYAVPMEVLSKGGMQVEMPKNNSKTYIARRWIPYGASSSQPNRFFADGTGDRSNTLAQAHQTQEGVTGVPESITAQNVTVVMRQYSCLYGWTDQTEDFYEDDIPEQMVKQVGERTTLVNEQVVYGELKSCTNQFYGGTGTSRATVNGGLSLGLLRRISKSLMANHGKVVTSVLKSSAQFGTDAVAPGYLVYINTDLSSDVRDLPGFIPAEKYASGKPMDNELGKCEEFRFIRSADLPSIQDAGAAVGATGLYSTSGSNIDVYQIVVTAADAWSQVSLRGKKAVDPTFIPTGTKTSSDPHGQRGYAGAIWYKAVMIENDGWMAIANVGHKTPV